MKLSYKLLNYIAEKYGEAYYLLDSKQFVKNYKELEKAFRDIYPNFNIAYSYKTNYTPKLCKIVNQLGGYAEVVSDMEYRLALKSGVMPKNIYFNGPYKDSYAVEELLLAGGTVNIDSNYDLKIIKEIAKKYPDNKLSVGIRCNFDVKDGVVSRFGFDINGDEFVTTINSIRETSNIILKGIHCHFATRSIETWPYRVKGMLNVVQKYFKEPPNFISLGGGLYGKMPDSLKKQFNVEIPKYEDYANTVAPQIRDFFKDVNESKKPMLIIEPGTALVGDVVKFVTKVLSIKDIRGKKIATLLGSIYNINPTLNRKNLPVTVYHSNDNVSNQQFYLNLDFGGYTCIESDYLYRGFSGNLAIGDYVVFDNVGSYSIVLKPPFILPNFAVVEYDEETNSIELIKRKESFEDIFKTFEF
ncbi:MAG: pyridoxal-dependent decarboxylase [Firmicutes bacterium]|nr:pyridoxal-dependent decarboxylase [Bacillota bacterium]